MSAPRNAVNYYRTGAYAVANLRIDYDLSEKLTVGVGGRNLFDAS